MAEQHPFKWRHFHSNIILLCVRWYLRYSLSYRDLEEMMAERGRSVDHVTIWRWVQRYAPILNQRILREICRPNRSWRVDETYVRVAGNWAYLYRAVDSAGDTSRFHVVTEARSDGRQALPAVGIVRKRWDAAAGGQCRWTSSIRPRYCRTEAIG